MFKSPSPLSEKARTTIAETLNARLADGLDLHSQIKVAHWNVKGPQFAALHPLFETFAVSLAGFNDTIAERAVTLGAQVAAPAISLQQQTMPSDVYGASDPDYPERKLIDCPPQTRSSI